MYNALVWLYLWEGWFGLQDLLFLQEFWSDRQNVICFIPRGIWTVVLCYPHQTLFRLGIRWPHTHTHTHSGMFLTKEVFWLLRIQEENYFDQSITIRSHPHSMLANQFLTKVHILSVTPNQLLWKGICSCTVSW